MIVYVKEWEAYSGTYELIPCPEISKEDVLLFHPKHIFAQKPYGLSAMEDEDYVFFGTPNSVPKNKFPVGTYGLKVKNFKEILASLPHFPNKKEGRRLRRKKHER